MDNVTEHPETPKPDSRSKELRDVPDAVQQALNARQFKTTECDSDDGVAVGDLRVATAVPGQPTDPTIVLIVRVDEYNEFVEVMFVHTMTENATEYDAVVPADSSGAAYDIVVQTDLRTVLWSSQLRNRIGNVDETLVAMFKTWGNRQTTPQHPDQTNDSGGDRNDPGGILRGTPLRGVTDRRWAFKETEGAAAHRLANDCVAVLLGETKPVSATVVRGLRVPS